MKITIITPEKTLYEGEAKDVQLVGLDGHFEILNHHAPIISALKRGNIKIIDTQGEEHIFPTSGGLLEMSNNEVQILVQ